jgi:preprotein translocase subunit YajC
MKTVKKMACNVGVGDELLTQGGAFATVFLGERIKKEYLTPDGKVEQKDDIYLYYKTQTGSTQKSRYSPKDKIDVKKED